MKQQAMSARRAAPLATIVVLVLAGCASTSPTSSDNLAPAPATNAPVEHPPETDRIEARIQANRATFEECRRGHAPHKTGELTVSFEIESDGKVSAARVSSTTLRNQELEKCFVAGVKGIRFEPSAKSGTFKVDYPFRIKPE